MSSSVWRARSVLLTGHTGFKGGWLSLWLHRLGAQVHGYSIDPPTMPSFFDVAGVRPLLASHTHADIADIAQLRQVMTSAQPQVIFHLAAQPLVRASYADPIGTFAANVMGTVNVLEAARAAASVRAVVVITTDKVYENQGSATPHAEDAPLGGHDPYSASKAAAEIAAASYRASFFRTHPNHARIATVRAGNVIGGGDWATDRLVPDCLRAFERGEPVRLRYPQAVRPWQHVLEPLDGYLQLAERLLDPDRQGFDRAWNFGPDQGTDASVGDVANALAVLWGDDARVVHATSESSLHEYPALRLDSSAARSKIDWRPRWSLQEALRYTVAWHRAWLRGEDMRSVSREQIDRYRAARV